MKSFTLVVSAAMASSVVAFAPINTKTQCANTDLAAMPPRKWDEMVDKTERSKAVPFLPRPINLDGSMVGDVGFDPFYLSSIPKDFSGFLQPPMWEQKSIPTLYWMREAELKHGRICMLAFVGWLATDGAFGINLRFPFPAYSVENVPTSFDAHDIMVQQGSMGALLSFIGLIEVTCGAALVQVGEGKSDREAGDFGFDPMGFIDGVSKEASDTMKLKELQNGRLAMLAFAGIVTQAGLSENAHTFPYLV
mmetsp:Transcript_6163/g.9363  ORF Transcript_6163/g.9363 Transcript_6163/m.9363 type:complete len:250 (+) Transcript_6163:130-879(+)|eukprot:CAMPEP_0118698048 /NCGR_PEP_ID=MMETSP0800-20121206/14947_1 /TAXON_ID=210618 ORGANISM="Striatella unipunctata, Strain CCMP2910" /NCGR_SAMPLE_ID=MMETSP0800 /ASSEMBLY_ACC=CAM_ASM_000638 /LENGTH=249 /DNA_ID=CAMNT_0006597751 /DNA_START=81 /DNA_END=830 /DNA_ORIENTATION=+